MRHYDMYDYYDYGNSYLDSIMWGIVMIVTIVLIVWAIFSLGSYILKGIGMYTIAKRIGIDYAWLAFVPFARTYLHGTLSGPILLKKKRIENPGVWLLALPFLYGAVYSILYAILWFIGFGALMKMDPYSHVPYKADISTGNIMGILVIFIILMVVVLGYAALYKALQVLVDHQILERFTSKNMSIVHGLLCTFIPLYESICFFVMRNRPFNPGMEPPTPTPFMQSPPPGPYYYDSGQTGYAGSYMQGGYSNPGGTSETSEPDNYRIFNGQAAQPGTGYGNDGTRSSTGADGYGSLPAAGADNPAETSAQEQDENFYNSAPVNFILPGNERTESQPPADTDSDLKADPTEDGPESDRACRPGPPR